LEGWKFFITIRVCSDAAAGIECNNWMRHLSREIHQLNKRLLLQTMQRVLYSPEKGTDRATGTESQQDS